MTPLRIANVPPPMSLLKLVLEHKAVDVALSMSGTHFAVLSDSNVAVYVVDLKARPISPPHLLWKSQSFNGQSPRQVTFLGDDRLCVLADIWDEEECSIWVSKYEDLVCLGPISEAEKISSLTSSVDFHNIYASFHNGAIHEIQGLDSRSGLPYQTTLSARLPAFNPEIKVTTLEGLVCNLKLGRITAN